MMAMILAAGRGQRMGSLTLRTPKPLLLVDQYTLIEHQIFRLNKAGYTDIVINTSWLATMIKDKLRDGSDYGVAIKYSHEPDALETGGGILQALPLLSERFVVINSDIWCQHDLLSTPPEDSLAHLVLVDNPGHNPTGDFSLNNGLVCAKTTRNNFTFSGIGWYHKALFHNCKAGKFPLSPLLNAAIKKEQVSGEYFKGLWSDIGTPERLQKIK